MTISDHKEFNLTAYESKNFWRRNLSKLSFIYNLENKEVNRLQATDHMTIPGLLVLSLGRNFLFL